MKDIDRKLNLVSTLFFILAGLGVPAALIAPVLLFQSAFAGEQQAKAVIMIGAAGGLIGSLLLISCIAIVGYAIRRRRWWQFCTTVSVLLLPSIPVGTALGIFGLIVLNKPEAKEMFAPNQ
jgi:hypothetical protein